MTPPHTDAVEPRRRAYHSPTQSDTGGGRDSGTYTDPVGRHAVFIFVGYPPLSLCLHPPPSRLRLRSPFVFNFPCTLFQILHLYRPTAEPAKAEEPFAWTAFWLPLLLRARRPRERNAGGGEDVRDDMLLWFTPRRRPLHLPPPRLPILRRLRRTRIRCRVVRAVVLMLQKYE
ncbi:hypothetical protein B0H16DRAFT_1026427 [Mycena metata]|uniref:Uncharacterized protein n=1 Tax=Mycena metata TaxID=1033252 RepID=A0AAD7IFR4_9AGAR|nr:hypothetical protein B0H16DRAFT_1026427 [Mycena metata]